jgi:hypothetical protein
LSGEDESQPHTHEAGGQPHRQRNGWSPHSHSDGFAASQGRWAQEAEARISLYRHDEVIARGLAFGLQGSPTLVDKTIPTFSRGELPHFGATTSAPRPRRCSASSSFLISSVAPARRASMPESNVVWSASVSAIQWDTGFFWARPRYARPVKNAPLRPHHSTALLRESVITFCVLGSVSRRSETCSTPPGYTQVCRRVTVSRSLSYFVFRIQLDR